MELHLATTPWQGLVFGLLTLPICVWALWTDLTAMRIRNVAVLALMAIFVVAGPFLLPFGEYLWRYAHFAVVLVVGYLMSATMGMGAGDAKFMAASAPFVALADVQLALMLYVVFSLALLMLMFAARATGAAQTVVPGWTWLSDYGRKRVPLGVGLAPMLTTYLLLAAIQPAAETLPLLPPSGGLLP